MKIVAIEIVPGERQIEMGFYKSALLSGESYGLAVIRDQDGRTVAEYQTAKKGWVIPDQEGVWDLVISDDEAV
jgi:hypothetical protein